MARPPTLLVGAALLLALLLHAAPAAAKLAWRRKALQAPGSKLPAQAPSPGPYTSDCPPSDTVRALTAREGGTCVRGLAGRSIPESGGLVPTH
jgi:hypothetical protein